MERHASASETVPATPDEVFDLITNVDRLPEWNAHLPKVVQPAVLCDEGDERVMEIHALGGHWNSRSHGHNATRPPTGSSTGRAATTATRRTRYWTWELTSVDEGHGSACIGH